MRSQGPLELDPLVRRGAASTVASLFTTPAQLCPERLALVDGERRITYAALSDRVRRLAAWLRRRGVGQGTRVAILSENRLEYLELFLAAAWLGAIVACQNWRLAPPELAHCLRLVEPEVMIVSPRHADACGEDRRRYSNQSRSSAKPTRRRWRRAIRAMWLRRSSWIPSLRCSSSTPAARPVCRRAR